MGWVRIIAAESLRKTGSEIYRVNLEQLRICLVQRDTSWFAIQDNCPHLGEKLSNGKVNYLNEIVCPWHSFRYNLKTGRECENRGPDAIIYRTELRDDGLYLEIPEK